MSTLMVFNDRSRTIVAVVAALVSATLVGLSAVGLSASQAVPADAGPALPSVAAFYALPAESGGLRVSFVQQADVVTATWMTPEGQTYGRGTYRWDLQTKSFKGRSSTQFLCLAEDGRTRSVVNHVVQEELHVVNDHELLDRWTKPMGVDCLAGVVDIFKWSERRWFATDREWKFMTAPAP